MPALASLSRGGGGGLITKSCPTLAIQWTGSLPGSSVHGTLQARILEWVAIFSLFSLVITINQKNVSKL